MAKKSKPNAAARRAVRHQLDRHATTLSVNAEGDDDELLTTPQIALLLQVSIQWLEIGRCKGYGPPYVRLGTHLIRYRRGTLREWLLGRAHTWTAEYTEVAP